MKRIQLKGRKGKRTNIARDLPRVEMPGKATTTPEHFKFDDNDSPIPVNKSTVSNPSPGKGDKDQGVVTKKPQANGDSTPKSELVKSNNGKVTPTKTQAAENTAIKENLSPTTSVEMNKLFTELRRTNELLCALVVEMRKRRENKKHKHSKTLKNDPAPRPATKDSAGKK